MALASFIGVLLVIACVVLQYHALRQIASKFIPLTDDNGGWIVVGSLILFATLCAETGSFGLGGQSSRPRHSCRRN